MTHQRAINSNTSSCLYPDTEPSTGTGTGADSEGGSRPSSPAAQTAPRTPSHRRQLSTASSVGSHGSAGAGGQKVSIDPGLIRLRPLVKGEDERLREKLRLCSAVKD